MHLISIIRAVLISSLAALPSSLLFIGYEGSIIKAAGWLGATIWVYFIAVIGCLIFGLPFHFVLQRMNIQSRAAYAVIGFLAPLLVMAFVPIISMNWSELIKPNNVLYSLVFAIAGMAVAVTLREMMALGKRH